MLNKPKTLLWGVFEVAEVLDSLAGYAVNHESGEYLSLKRQRKD